VSFSFPSGLNFTTTMSAIDLILQKVQKSKETSFVIEKANKNLVVNNLQYGPSKKKNILAKICFTYILF